HALADPHFRRVGVLIVGVEQTPARDVILATQGAAAAARADIFGAFDEIAAPALRLTHAPKQRRGREGDLHEFIDASAARAADSAGAAALGDENDRHAPVHFAAFARADALGHRDAVAAKHVPGGDDDVRLEELQHLDAKVSAFDVLNDDRAHRAQRLDRQPPLEWLVVNDQ